MRTLPSFSHKDYVLIADIIASLRLSDDYIAPNGLDDAREYVAEKFASALSGTNPAFNADRFIAAATGKPYSRRDVQR